MAPDTDRRAAVHTAPFGGNTLRIIFWSLELRARAWWNDTHKGPKPDVRLFVLYHDPAASPRLPHSTVTPQASPRFPQRRAEIMAGRIPISETLAEMPAGMTQVVIGAQMPREINWTKEGPGSSRSP